jgi:hypothetical protein
MGTLIDPTEYGVADAEEPKVVKAGEEYKLRILSVDKGTDKNNLDYIMPRLEIVESPTSKDFTHFLHIPDKNNMSEKQLNRARWAWQSFCECFDIPLDMPTDPEDDWAGNEGWAILGMKEDEQYGEQNFIKKLISPK